MVIQKIVIFLSGRVVGQALLTCLATFPVISYAASINILSAELAVSLQVLDESYTYAGSGFEVPEWNAINVETSLPNSDSGDPPSWFSSAYWWYVLQGDDGFGFMGDANTDRYIGGGDYDPDANVYASSLVSFNMRFAVEGEGASLFSSIVNGSAFDSSVTILDLTAGTLFSGGELLSDHEYQVSAWSRNENSSGSENIFRLDFLDAEANVPEPSAILLVVAGLAGLGFVSSKRKQMELLGRAC